MSENLFAGIDCGATKVLIQSAIFNPETNNISPGTLHQEYLYSDHPDWDENFLPVHLDIQQHEYQIGQISINTAERIQGKVIIDTIRQALSDLHNYKTGLCFPGIKTEKGIAILANGPRINNLLDQLENIYSLYHDSDCCVIGEWKSTIGKMKNVNNSIYIGGGTGIADGIILNGKIIDFNQKESPKRSWALMLPSGDSVESWLSPSGLIKHYNKSHNTDIKTLFELSQSKHYTHFFDKTLEAFVFLINNRINFFNKYNQIIEKVVIGQRLGHFLFNHKENAGKMFKKCTNLKIDFSEDRRTAALGAAWSRICL